MTKLHVDFETYSTCDLNARGTANYAAHPSTGVHCMGYTFGDEPVSVWIPYQDPIPDRIVKHVRGGGLVYAHNATFELAVWNGVLRRMNPELPPLEPEQVRCTMAMCYSMSLPGSLGEAAAALGLKQRKDAVGGRIMLRWCRPQPNGQFLRPEDDPEQFLALCAYCAQDVATERELHSRLLELSESEQRLWVLDQRINGRGVGVDLRSIDQAIELVEMEKKRLNARMLQVTGGTVGSCSEVQMLVKWIRQQGVQIQGVAKADVLDALSGDLPDSVREALELRKEASRSSTAKLIAMRDRASDDGRVRGVHQYHGANTGRWAGRGVQLQNFPRPRKNTKLPDIQDILANIGNRDYIDVFHGPVMDAVADILRAMIVPAPGHDFIAADFSAIEARVLAWLAGEERVLDVFRGDGKIYEHAAAGIYSVRPDDVTQDQRQIGKVAVLALGYGGGVGAFQAMARAYGVTVDDGAAEQIKTAWRESHPRIVSYWYDLEAAAIEAVTTGAVVRAGAKGREVAYRKAGSFLWCRLPSGRVICYPYPEIREVETPWGSAKDAVTYMTQVTNSKTVPDPNAAGKWQRVSVYGGSLAENVTQAVARDLLAEAMLRLEAAGYRVVFHVHDEVVVEVPSSAPATALREVESIMATCPHWAKGLPLAAEGWRGPRYRK